jgi:hypothetical protein
MKNNLIGHDSWKTIFNPDSDIIDFRGFINDKEVIVLRAILFFHAEEKTTLSRIRAHFTDHAISKLVYDNFIKIEEK